MERIEELKALIVEIEAEADKFYTKGNKAAGTRLRKSCQTLKNLAQEIRVDVSEKKKTEAVA
jgi:hypothetical protein